MPEGDSVYLVARTLDKHLRDHVLEHAELRVPSLATRDLTGRTVLGTDTHGKHLLTRLSGEVTLHTHLRMDGSWNVVGPGKRLPSRMLPDVRVLLRTEAGRTAYGVKLPVVDLVETSREDTVVGHLGPDPLRDDWDAAEAVRRFGEHPDRPLVSALLDQRLMAGLGNLWANELCFLTGHSPWTPVRDVDVPALVRLAARALRHSALVPRAYQVTTGNTHRGETHYVAGRQRRPCLRCGTPVRMVEELPMDPANRRAWWCPRCQPGPGPEARAPSTRPTGG
jgi:formamidopyrimidine-DNA glycosylase